MRNPQLLALAACAVTAAAIPFPFDIFQAPDPPRAIPESAPDNPKNFQPILDYDSDSCYNVPAVDAQGNVTQGLSPEHSTNTADCRNTPDLDNQNVYSRTRCNNGWCAYMYAHYFEKDVALEHSVGELAGHRHEWEEIVVFVKNGESKPAFVAASAHNDYDTKPASEVRFDGSHAKIVYHKGGIGTHSFRFANPSDDKIENAKGQWIRGALIDYNSWPSNQVRDKMAATFNGGGIKFKLTDGLFPEYLKKAASNKVAGFDPNKDA
ncbi:NLP effector protein 10 [Cladobotryum mycophilum]|uniref:NLP effector protein 10 n=1 Tax=Cladobotryum mycophilum TaxID=491253 RepID=A0ABR0SB64_9HYPO